MNVSFKEWIVPTLGSRPHDPLAARDGSIWWTGQWPDGLGRVDPKTGAMKEFPLKTPNSGPHGLVEDKDGNIWYTGINAQEVGKLDPKTGDVTEYKLNPEGARGPHTPIFDQKGMLWFTLQSGHVGRLNPATGEMKIVTSPSRSELSVRHPGGLQGPPLVRRFPATEAGEHRSDDDGDQGYTLPSADARPRRIAHHRRRRDLVHGLPARLPRPLRSEDRPVQGMAVARRQGSQPYGIATVGDIVWYSESGVKPNTLVRFDPKTEKFQTWAIPPAAASSAT